MEWTPAITHWRGSPLLVTPYNLTSETFTTESLSTGTVTFKESSVIVTGGYDNSRLASTELIPSSCSIPDLPIVRTAHVTFLHRVSSHPEPKLVTCGGLVGLPEGVLDGGCCNSNDATNECLVLDMATATWGTGVVGSLDQSRWRASAVSLPVGVYVLGGNGGTASSEFLPAGKTVWTEGPDLPISFRHACAVAISTTRFLIMRRDSLTSSGSIREYDTDTVMGPTSNDGWQPVDTWPELLNKRYSGMGCAVVGTKLVIAGGSGDGGYQKSTEIVNLETRSIEKGQDMLQKRAWFHLLPIFSSGEPVLWAVSGWSGGGFLSTVEQWNPETRTWTDAGQLIQRRGDFGAVAVDQNMFCTPSVSTTVSQFSTTTVGNINPSSVLLVGGDPWSTSRDVEFFPSAPCEVAPLPTRTRFHASFVRTNGQIVSCGGTVDLGKQSKDCVALNTAKGTWESGVVGSLPARLVPDWGEGVDPEDFKDFEDMTWFRSSTAAVSMPVGVYLVEGYGALKFDFLPSGKSEWVIGPNFPTQSMILHAWSFCAAAISPYNFVVVGGSMRKILEYNTTNLGGPTSSEGWQPEDTWPELLIERVYGYACGVIGTTMVIAGGEQWSGSYLKSTELVDLATRTSKQGPDMLQTRAWFHLIPITPESSQLTLLALGGYEEIEPASPSADIDRLTVEGWTPEMGNWTKVAQLSKPRYKFGAFALDKDLCA